MFHGRITQLRLTIALIFLLAIPFWCFLAAPYFKKMPSDFSYQADILSLDNFYDTNHSQFIGEQISNTKFSYNVVEVEPKYYVIKNIFKVIKQSGEPIISVERLYTINPYTGKHVGQHRMGYLFAPRYASKNNYIYWHVNYNKPAMLSYAGTEKLNGLKVYKYNSQFSVDQTKELGYLPGVPKKYGIVTDVVLNLWIEPVSGWLIEYKDDAIVWYYDSATKQRLYPWNKFSNRYTQNSIDEQITTAKKLKYHILLIDFGIPILLFTLTMIILYWNYFKRQLVKFRLEKMEQFQTRLDQYVFIPIVCGILIIVISSLAFLFFINEHFNNKYLIGIARWDSNPEYDQVIQGFKDGLVGEGFYEISNVKFIEENAYGQIEKQIENIQSLLSKKVDLIFSFTMKGTLIAKGMTHTTPVIFTLAPYPIESNLIQSLNNSNNNLTGNRTYTPPANQYHVLETLYPNIKTLGFIHRSGNPTSAIQYQEYKKMLSARNIKVIDMAAIDYADLATQLTKQNQALDAIFLACDSWIQDQGGQTAIDFANKNKIPTLSCDKSNVIKGALIGYVADFYSSSQMAGKTAAWILRGAEPHWLPIKTVAKGYLIINLKTAALLGITIPDKLIKAADYVINP